MIHVKTFACNMLQVNCYVVSDDSRQAVVIDPGALYDAERQAIARYVSEQRLMPVSVLCTHGHFDHVMGADFFFDTYGLRPSMHRLDEGLYRSYADQFRMFLGVDTRQQMPPVGPLFDDGDTIVFGRHSLDVVHTPGHSPGSVMLVCADEDIVFSGDTLFRMGVGRTDLQGGSWNQLMDSLATRVAKLPATMTVYTGHGPQTTIADELRTNPYLRQF